MSENSDEFDDSLRIERDDGRLGESLSRNESSPSDRWVWLRKMLWEERKSKVGTTQGTPQWTRKRKQSVVDPFLKRFSTRELYGLNHLPEAQVHSRDHVLIHEEQQSTHDNFAKETDPEQPNKPSHDGIQNTQKRDLHWLRSAVFNPKSSFIYFWNCVLALGIFYHLWTIIYRIAFLESNHTSGGQITFLVFDYIADVVYVLDIIITSRISFLENGILVTDVKKVAFTYLFTRVFFIDILATLPVDFLYIGFGIMPTLRLIRLVKVYKLFKVKTDVESMSSFPALLRASLLVHSMLLLIHWNASFYFMISKSEGFGTNDWVYPALNGSFMGPARKYARSFYWSTLTLTAIGDLPAPETNLEYFYTICCYLCGIFMFATVVGNIGSIILNRNSNKLIFERHRDEARNYMEERKVPKELQERVLLWYDYAFQRGRINGVDDLNSLNLLPDKMKTELAIHIHLDTLKKVTFLQKCQPEFLHDLLLKMKLIIYTPGDLIIRRGEIAREMYLISDGIVQIIGESGKVLKELGTGGFFGEIGILNLSRGQNRRIADVRSVGYTECFMLLREDVLAATRDYPEAQVVLTAYGRERLNKTRQSKESITTTSPQDNGKRAPQIEMQVIRESVSSRAQENEGFTKEESDENKGGGIKMVNGLQGAVQVNRLSLPKDRKETMLRNSRIRQSQDSTKEKSNASHQDEDQMQLMEQLKKSITTKDKEITLLKDVVSELQQEKESHARDVDNLKTEIQNSFNELREMEENNLKLRHLNETKEITNQELQDKLKEYKRIRNEQDLVVTEVNECNDVH